MAGVKVTDLTTLGTAEATDIFYIVDESANQSKKIEVQNIYSGLPQFESGTFAPVISNISDSSIVTVSNCIYSKVGDIVTMSMFLNVEIDAAELAVTFNFSLPVATTFSARTQLIGNSTSFTDLNDSLIEASTVDTDLGIMNLTSLSTGSVFNRLAVTIQYQVL
jgi:hypothetical protein